MLKAQKNIMTTAVMATLTATLMLTAIDSQARDTGKGHNVEAFFNRLDTDDSGFLVVDEIIAPALNKSEKRFNRKDKDADGFLSFEEATAGHNGDDLSLIADEIVQCVEDIKAETGNEYIVVPDISHFMSVEDKFASIDTSGDELIDLAELKAATTDKARNKFSHMDSDASSEVSLDEFIAHSKMRRATRRAIKSCIEEINEIVF